MSVEVTSIVEELEQYPILWVTYYGRGRRCGICGRFTSYGWRLESGAARGISFVCSECSPSNPMREAL